MPSSKRLEKDWPYMTSASLVEEVFMAKIRKKGVVLLSALWL